MIICPRPSIAGTFEKRCRLHKRTNSTFEVYQHNVGNRITAAETETFVQRDPHRPLSIIQQIRQAFPLTSFIDPNGRPQSRPTAAGIQRIKDLKESTRP